MKSLSRRCLLGLWFGYWLSKVVGENLLQLQETVKRNQFLVGDGVTHVGGEHLPLSSAISFLSSLDSNADNHAEI